MTDHTAWLLALKEGDRLPTWRVVATRPEMSGRSSPIFSDEGAREHGFQRSLVPTGAGRHFNAYLADLFRLDWFRSGRLSVSHLSPVYNGDRIALQAVVRGVRDLDGGRQIYLELWSENAQGKTTTRGEASCVILNANHR